MRQLTEAEQHEVADIFTRHQSYIESVARQYAPTSQDVPDVVQAVGVSLCRGLSGFKGQSSIKTWLFRVTVNAARDIYRADYRHLERTRTAMDGQVTEAVIVDLDEHVHQVSRAAQLQAAIERLRPDHQKTIRDHLNGAGVQSDQKPRMKSRRWRARVALRQVMGEA